MALPKIDAPVYEVQLPLSKKQIRFRPFLVKEQKNLLMAMESDDSETIERNIRQVLTNCTVTENIDIDKLPVVDIEYYFLNLRARSVGEIVEGEYICNNTVDGKDCNGRMKTSFNLLEITVDVNPDKKDLIQITDKIAIKLKYPEFSLVQSDNKKQIKNTKAPNNNAISKIDPKIIKLFADSIDDLEDENGWAFLGELGNLMLKKKPDFDPRNYGFPKMLALIKSMNKFVIDERESGKNNIKHIYVKRK